MTNRISVLVVYLILSAAEVAGQQWKDWAPTSDNSGILYRSQAFANAEACYLEFRDPQQKSGNTTFDVAVDYRSLELNANKEPIAKAETQHIVVTPNRVSSSRISNCSSIANVRASFVQRH